MNKETARVIKAPTGTALTAKSWLTEAPLRMIMNNLDPDVAERPEELVVYGGIGKAVVTLDSAPIREVVDVDRDCVLFDGSTAGLVASLDALKIDPARREALARSLHSVVTERYSWDAAGARIEALVDAVAGSRGADSGAGSPSRPVLP